MRKAKLHRRRAGTTRRGLGTAVKPHIYRYGKGELEGFQARLKRASRRGKPESISKYFSFARYGSRPAAEAAAERWLQRNRRWLDDRAFRPQNDRKRHQAGHLRVVRGGSRTGTRKSARAA